MQSSIFRVSLAIALISTATIVYAEQATEIFIPIGQSPGLSHKYTVIGEVEAIDPGGQTITVSAPSGSHNVTLTARTQIWLDRSSLKLTNLDGTPADIQIGRTVEINYEEDAPNGDAKWVKVQITEP